MFSMIRIHRGIQYEKSVLFYSFVIGIGLVVVGIGIISFIKILIFLIYSYVDLHCF